MSSRQKSDSSSRFRNSEKVSNLQLHVRDVPFSFNRELLAAKSAKVAALLKRNSKDEISAFLGHISEVPETYDMVVNFCCGNEIQITTENIIPLARLAILLEMTENHSKNNLLAKVLTFFEKRVLPNWNETIKVLLSIKNLNQAKEIGIFDACLNSIIEKIQFDPLILGDPLKTLACSDRFLLENDKAYRPNARRKLFGLDNLESEDLTVLSIEIYELIIHEMKRLGIPPEYVAASICKYAEKWVLNCRIAEEDMSVYKRNSQREVLEAVERLLPNEIGFIPCSMLFYLFRFAIVLEASSDCKEGIEARIGRQLDQAKASDLFVPFNGNSEELQNNVDFLRRIMKCFYQNYTTTSRDVSGILRIAQLVEEFLIELARHRNLEAMTFISTAELAIAASMGTNRNHDGIYSALDIYLDKHRDMTESEKEKVCQVLDCQMMSPEALEHAAKNERLPLRVVVQVLFVGQLQLRERVVSEIKAIDEKMREEEEVNSEKEVLGAEMEIVNKKVTELEKESYMIRKEIEKCHSHNSKKGKASVWTQMKRKFGCISSPNAGNPRVNKKKVHP